MKKSTKRGTRKVLKCLLHTTAVVSFVLLLLFTGDCENNALTVGEYIPKAVACLSFFGGSLSLYNILFGGNNYAK